MYIKSLPVEKSSVFITPHPATFTALFMRSLCDKGARGRQIGRTNSKRIKASIKKIIKKTKRTVGISYFHPS